MKTGWGSDDVPAADAAELPRAVSFGPPLVVGSEAPVADDTAWPRAVSLGPDWTDGVTVVLELSDESERRAIEPAIAAPTTSISTMSCTRRLERMLGWGWAKPDIWASFVGLDGLTPQTMRGGRKGSATAR